MQPYHEYTPDQSFLLPPSLDSLLEVVRTVQLKGLCTSERAASALGMSAARVEDVIGAAPGLFRATARGFTLTPEGRTWVESALASERLGADQASLEACYAAFVALNAEFKRLVSDWQMATTPGRTNEDVAAMVGNLGLLHAGLSQVVSTASALAPRLEGYRSRFADALAQLEGGDLSMLASPLKDSYHTVWFEYHEELIELCGRDRLADERSEN